MEAAIDILTKLSRRRRALQMPYPELGLRSGVPVSTLKRVLSGQTTAGFATVAAIADALGVCLAEAPATDIALMRQRQARAKARSLTAMVQGTSALEAQAVDPGEVELMEQRTVAELLSGSGRRLWAR
jgi:transcriptional regulator with XRE-family HTH domain